MEEPAVPPEEKKEDVQEEVSELEKSQAAAEEYLQGWKRAIADYANLKKETEKFKDEFGKYAASRAVEKLIPVFDSFEKAVETAPKEAEAKQWVSGIAQIYGQMTAALRELGVEKISESGVPFDPSRHEAMMEEASEGVAPGTVLRVLESGFQMNDRILRPAKVVVAR